MTMTRRRALRPFAHLTVGRATALLVAVVLAVSVSGLDRARAEERTVDIAGLAFNPEEITIRAGDTIKWINHDSDHHDLQGGPIQSHELAQGETYSQLFNDPAEIDYMCRIHTYMHGRVIVQTADGQAPPPAPEQSPDAPPAQASTTTNTSAGVIPSPASLLP
jgi:plastocyanin